MTILLREIKIGSGARGAVGSEAHINDQVTLQSELPVASKYLIEAIINLPFTDEQGIVSVKAIV